MNLLRFPLRKAHDRRADPGRGPQPAQHLVRRFIETGDPRCPLAGLWLVLTDAPVDEDAHKPWAVMDLLFRGGPPVHLAFIGVR